MGIGATCDDLYEIVDGKRVQLTHTAFDACVMAKLALPLGNFVRLSGLAGPLATFFFICRLRSIRTADPTSRSFPMIAGHAIARFRITLTPGTWCQTSRRKLSVRVTRWTNSSGRFTSISAPASSWCGLCFRAWRRFTCTNRRRGYGC